MFDPTDTDRADAARELERGRPLRVGVDDLLSVIPRVPPVEPPVPAAAPLPLGSATFPWRAHRRDVTVGASALVGTCARTLPE